MQVNMLRVRWLLFSLCFLMVPRDSSLVPVRKCLGLTNTPSISHIFANVSAGESCEFGQSLDLACCPKRDVWDETSLRMSKSREKCEEYGSYVFIKKGLLGSNNKKLAINSCGLKPQYVTSERLSQKRMQNSYKVIGVSTVNRQFPHTAALGINTNATSFVWVCTGALISDLYVLTAAHCLNHELHGPLKLARFGVNLLSADGIDDDGTMTSPTYNVEKVIPHPMFSGGRFYHDIGLVKLTQPVKFNVFVRPACLPNTHEGPERKAFSLGFRDLFFGDLHITTLLEYAVVDKIPHQECATAHQRNENLTRGIDDSVHVCIALRDELIGLDSCEDETMDGVLQTYDTSQYCMYSITGVKIMGGWCSTPDKPAIYARVYYYMDWIESIVWGRDGS